jgi:hypothetical protein
MLLSSVSLRARRVLGAGIIAVIVGSASVVATAAGPAQAVVTPVFSVSANSGAPGDLVIVSGNDCFAVGGVVAHVIVYQGVKPVPVGAAPTADALGGGHHPGRAGRHLDLSEEHPRRGGRWSHHLLGQLRGRQLAERVGPDLLVQPGRQLHGVRRYDHDRGAGDHDDRVADHHGRSGHDDHDHGPGFDDHGGSGGQGGGRESDPLLHRLAGQVAIPGRAKPSIPGPPAIERASSGRRQLRLAGRPAVATRKKSWPGVGTWRLGVA